MKLPVQAAAILREGHSWPARRSSAHGVSASFRSDFDVCVGNASRDKWKCNFDSNYQVCRCPNGTCNCCQYGCEPAKDGNAILTGGCACKPKP